MNPSNLDAYYVEPSTYELIQAVSLILKGALGITLIVAVLGLLVSPTLSLEMMMMLQVSFFSVALLQEVQPTLAAAGTLSLAVNGYNQLLSYFSEDLLDIKSVSLTKILEQMSMSPRLIGNFNIMLFVEIFLAVSTVVTVTISSKFKTNNVLKALGRVLTVTTMSLMVFSTFNLGVGIGLEITYFSRPVYKGVRAAIFVSTVLVAFALRVIGLHLVLKKPGEYTFSDPKILKDWLHSSFSKYHLAQLIGYRLFLGVCIGAFNQYTYTCVVVCVIQSAMVIYTISTRPYSTRLMLGRAILNDLASLSIFLVVTLYVLVFNGDNVALQAPATASFSIMITVLLVNIICIAYATFMKSPIIYSTGNETVVSLGKQVLDESAMNNSATVPANGDTAITMVTSEVHINPFIEEPKPRRSKL